MAEHFWYEHLSLNVFIAKILFKDALKDGNVVVTTLSNLFDDECHTVLIYSIENYKFKVKDSYGNKYEIPIDRPDSIQVCRKYFLWNIIQNLNFKLGQNHATSKTGIQ